ncbi:hypothetical protein HBI23_248450 [Parastagonospora nodorum]|nr:hypothetical protein HBI23_248450 [Parastagonospora nodorum]
MHAISGPLAKLRPNNDQAFVAFHNAASLPLTEARAAHARRFMLVDYPSSESRYSTQPDTPTKEDRQRLQTGKHDGCYLFNLSDRDPAKDHEWVAGSGDPTKPDSCQILLGHNDISAYNVMFAVCKTTGFMTLRVPSSAVRDVRVNGSKITTASYCLNERRSRLQIGGLHFDFEYCPYSDSAEYLEERLAFLKLAYGNSVAETLHHTPTPGRAESRIGQWTVSKQLGRGAHGKVYSATNSDGGVVAIKTMSHTKRAEKIAETLANITRLAKADGCIHVLYLLETIPTVSLHASTNTPTPEVNFVLQPAVAFTLSEYSSSSSIQGHPTPLRLLRDILEGICFLHLHGFMHGDIKPPNIGVSNGHAILLDADDARGLLHDQTVPPTPGHGGTVGWLAPERELRHYDQTVDVWAAGVVAFQLFFGHHPWMGEDPWKPGNSHLRPDFEIKYGIAVQELEGRDAVVNDLILSMLRHPYTTTTNLGRRPNARNTLEHACWKDL